MSTQEGEAYPLARVAAPVDEGQRLDSRVGRLALKLVGLASVGLGLLGALLPLLPTTPFVLLGAWCFARSSPRLHDWLRNHDTLGPPLRAWRRHRALPPRAKRAGIASLWVTIPVTIYLSPLALVKVLLALLLVVATLLLACIPTLEPHKASNLEPS